MMGGCPARWRRMQAADVARRCVDRGTGKGPLVVFYSPKTERFRWAGAQTETCRRLESIEDDGHLLWIGVYGPPWEWAKPEGSTRVQQIRDWILEDLDAALGVADD